MSLLREGTVNNDGCVFRQNFLARRYVLDATGVLVGCTVGLNGPGIKPTAASSRVTYDNTRALLINANKMTIRLRFRTGSAVPPLGWCNFLCKSPTALNDNQFFVQRLNAGQLTLYIANAAGDSGQYISTNLVLAASTEYIAHFVYDGTLVAGSRGVIYLGGTVTASTITGLLPASMRASASPLTVFNLHGGAASAPATDTTLLDCALWSKAFSPDECLLDARDETYGGF
jgi:hypothetical protein